MLSTKKNILGLPWAKTCFGLYTRGWAQAAALYLLARQADDDGVSYCDDVDHHRIEVPASNLAMRRGALGRWRADAVAVVWHVHRQRPITCGIHAAMV